MAAHRPSRVLAISDTMYGLLLHACPTQYRREYGALMAQAFRDLARAAYCRHGVRGILALWVRTLPDACSTAIAEHIVALKERRAIANAELAAAGAQGGYAMRSSLSTAGTWAVSIAALLVGVFCIWPFYFLAVYALGWRLLPGSVVSSPPFQWLGIPMLFWSFPPSIFLSDLGRYLSLSAVGILLALAALRFGRRSRVLRVAEALTLVAILAFPWFFHYQPPVVAAPGGVLHVPTRPGLLGGVVKQAQAFAELVPSTYTLLGWSADGVLYYQETDTATYAIRTWAFTPGADARPQLVAVPTSIVPTAVTPRKSLLELVRAPAWPASAEPGSRSLKIRQDGLASADGRWAAAVAKHIYGPEDVIIVALE